MHLIDRYAYTSRLRAVDPAQKAAISATVMVLCLALNQPLVGLLATAAMWAIGTFHAGLAGRIFARLLLAEGLFLALSVASVAISAQLAPPPSSVWAARVGPLWLTSSPALLHTALTLLTRALGCAAALNLLALTTPVTDMVELLRRLRLPALLIELMLLVYRFIFTLLESMEHMYIAQDSRLGYGTARQGLHSAALLGSRLFIHAYQRGRRLQTALESRGYDGDLRVLPPEYRYDAWLWCWGGATVIAQVLAWLLVQ